MRRWTSSYRFNWTPIITFTRRQLQLRDWIEENLEPVAFRDQHDEIGFALVHRSIRINLSSNGMTLQDGVASEAGITPLLPVLDGVLKILEPKQITLSSAAIAWSSPLEGLTYTEGTAQFAHFLSGLSLDDEVVRPTDASGLLDAETASHKIQAEWGVVSAQELIDRLSGPTRGRLADNRPEATLLGIGPEDLPPASLFVDTTLSHRHSDYLDGRSGIENALDIVEGISSNIASLIYENAAAEIGKSL